MAAVADPVEGTMALPDLLGSGAPRPFRLCLNTSTLRGHGLSLPELVEIAAAAGYDAIEPWIDELDRFEAEGGSLQDVAGRLRDHGLAVESAIGFFNWIDDDGSAREAGLTEARRSMAVLSRLGGSRIAAPPFGIHEVGSARVDLLAAADRYRVLLELGDETGVLPLVEVWGFSANLSRLGEAALVAAESGRRDAAILADIYHLYKGGSPIESLGLLGPQALGLFHMNDFPGIPPALIGDGDRVFPGDGIAPLDRTLRLLHGIGYRGALSLELFNEAYWRRDPLEVARTGREKLEAAIERALGWPA
ncbi:MAG: sugar phosphate isomerase/epimerase family protein [Armatimonadota bacterium]